MSRAFDGDSFEHRENEDDVTPQYRRHSSTALGVGAGSGSGVGVGVGAVPAVYTFDDLDDIVDNVEYVDEEAVMNWHGGSAAVTSATGMHSTTGDSAGMDTDGPPNTNGMHDQVLHLKVNHELPMLDDFDAVMTDDKSHTALGVEANAKGEVDNIATTTATTSTPGAPQSHSDTDTNTNGSTIANAESVSGSTSASASSSTMSTHIGRWVIKEKLGLGTYGVVYSANEIGTRKIAAVKVINKASVPQRSLADVETEIKVLRNAQQYPYIIGLYDVVDTPQKISIVMEYGSGGDLYHQVMKTGPLREPEACRLFVQLVLALDFLHRVIGVSHGDIKLENILFDNRRTRNVKLTDFGLAAYITQHDKNNEPCLVYRHRGTPAYAAPEVIAHLSADGGYKGDKADIWSSGVVLFVLLCGYMPFEARTFPEMRTAVVEGKYTVPPDLSEKATSLLARMLEVDAEKRITIDEIKQHPWCAKYFGIAESALASGTTVGVYGTVPSPLSSAVKTDLADINFTATLQMSPVVGATPTRKPYHDTDDVPDLHLGPNTPEQNKDGKDHEMQIAITAPTTPPRPVQPPHRLSHQHWIAVSMGTMTAGSGTFSPGASGVLAPSLRGKDQTQKKQKNTQTHFCLCELY
jgi:serine/threonine protein kinase